MKENRLTIALAEFKSAMKPFVRKNIRLGPVLMAYEGGFLSIESGDVVVVMRADGAWNGRASFQPGVLQALGMIPPTINPVSLAYADGHLLLAGLTIPCRWELASKALVADLLNPSMLHLLALARSIPRAEMWGTDQGRQIASALQATERRIKSAAKQLDPFGISETEIRQLVEQRLQEYCERASG